MKLFASITILTVLSILFLGNNVALSQQFIFTKDTLNLGQIDSNLIRAYTNIKIKDAWQKIEELNPTFIEKIKIMIIDSGVDSSHPEFVNPKVDLGSAPPNALFDNDPTGHGTQINGIIGANNVLGSGGTLPSNSPQMNGILSGVKNLDYALENVFNGGPSLARVLYAIYVSTTLKSADIVNISHIFNYPDCNPIQTGALLALFSPAFSFHPNTLFITAAGETTPEISDASCFLPGALGRQLSNVINVGGLDFTGQKRWFGSPSGAAVNISAPAENVYAPAPRGKGDYPADTKNYDTIFGGTSASAPMVTGVAAILKAIKPELTPTEIKNILVRTADPIQTGEPDKRIGTGCYSNPNDPVNTGCRLNALKAAQAILAPKLQILKSIPIEINPVSIKLSPDASRAYAVNSNPGTSPRQGSGLIVVI
ncbi:MAG: S8/S53 family peptidase [Candidatus Giovannonibacteria bacterium]|nr:S8/S53 family peptidase [Candidatus Giovannonibacteria bacterium]